MMQIFRNSIFQRGRTKKRRRQRRQGSSRRGTAHNPKCEYITVLSILYRNQDVRSSLCTVTHKTTKW